MTNILFPPTPDVSSLFDTAAVGASTARLKHSRLRPLLPDGALAAPRFVAQPSPLLFSEEGVGL